MKPLHEELREIRLEKGITLEKIHEDTKINISFLRSIEEGDFSLVPLPFIRAFLREYAEVLGLDPDRVMDRFENKADFIREADPPVQPPEKSNSEEHAGSYDTGVETPSEHEPESDLAESEPEPEPETPEPEQPETDAEEPETESQSEEIPETPEQEQENESAQTEVEEPGESAQKDSDDMQAFLFENDMDSSPEKTEAVAEKPENHVQPSFPDDAYSVVADEAVPEVSDAQSSQEKPVPVKHKRLDIEEPGQTNIVFITGFIIIIIIAAVIIFLINRGLL